MVYRTPFFLPWLYPTLTWRMPSDSRCIYLTLDDGPVVGPTEFVLDTLHSFGISATFFCIGDNIRKHPQLMHRILSEGHGVANHTFHHLNGWKYSPDSYLKNVLQCDEELRNYSGTSPDLFRPPYGRIKRSQIRLLQNKQIIMWDVLTNDYQASITPEDCLKNSVKATRPGSIVVFHDSFKAEKNLTYALPRYVEWALKNGYSFKTWRDEA